MKLRAFTLIEVLIVVSLLAGSIALVMSWTLTAMDQAKLQTTAESFMSVMRRQQSSSRSTRSTLPHGINLESTQYTIFTGSDFASSDPLTHQTFPFPDEITLSNITLTGGGSEIIFDRASGETSQDGNVTISHADLSNTYVLTITPLGLITW